ncbi:hypothetical protein AB1Y20_001928 [Prymnesium parvum]|uniref:Mono(ADP-ribosyl)transferase n=1 Tax=Prymnesium parvum TaxID=97485 RepID=A0AB34J933_PRYPA
MGGGASRAGPASQKDLRAKVEAVSAFTRLKERAAAPFTEPSTEWSVDAWLSSVDTSAVLAAVLTDELRRDDDGRTDLQLLGTLAADPDGESRLLTMLEHGHTLQKLASVIWSDTRALLPPHAPPGDGRDARQAGAAAAVEGNKFQARSAELGFSDLTTFFHGLEGLVGAPHKRVELGMQTEHTNGYDAHVAFITPNYRVHTTSFAEWWFVFDPEKPTDEVLDVLSSLREASASKKDPKKPLWPAENPSSLAGLTTRTPKPLHSFTPQLEQHNKKLAEIGQDQVQHVEMLAARLYTGPMFVKYNAVLRGLQLHSCRSLFVKLCCSASVANKFEAKAINFDDAMQQANLYSTTILAINSAVVKLSKLTKAATVFRGVSGGELPASFYQPNEFNVRGGVEAAFMSTTLSLDVALAYANSSGGSGIVFAMHQGMVDRGAELQWLSQYPDERETLFGPLTGLEVQGMRVCGSVRIVDVRLSVNLNVATMERVVARNLTALLDIAANTRFEVREKFRSSGLSDAAEHWLASVIDRHVSGSPLNKEPEWYNEDRNFVAAVKELMDAKKGLLASSVLPLLEWIETHPQELSSSTCHALARTLENEFSVARKTEFDLCIALLEKLPPHERQRYGDSLVLGRQKVAIYPLLEGGAQEKLQAVALFRKLPLDELMRHAPRLASLLRDGDALVRRHALQLHDCTPQLFKVNEADVVAALGDKDAEVRVAALRVLISKGLVGKYSDQVSALKQDPSSEVRIAATDALLRMSPEHGSSLEAELTSADREVALKALQLLASADSDAAVSEQLPRLAHTIVESCLKTAALVEPALAALRRLPPALLADRMERISQLLDRPAPRKQVIALVQSMPPEYAPVLASCLEAHRPEWLQRAALTAMAQMPPEVVAQQCNLIVSFTSHPEWAVRRDALKARQPAGIGAALLELSLLRRSPRRLAHTSS